MVALLAAGTAHAETLSGAIQAARISNPRLTAARAAYLSATAQTAIAASSGRPALAVNAQLSHDFDSDRYGPRFRDLSTIALAVPLYSGGRVRSAVKAQRALADAASLTVGQRDMELGRDVVETYLELLDARDLQRLNRAHLDRLSGYATMIDRERSQGLLGRADVARSRARLAGARIGLIAADGQEAAARETYRSLVGKPIDDVTLPLPLDLPYTADEIEAAVVHDNQALRVLRLRVVAATQAIEVQRAIGRPTLVLRADANYGNSTADIAAPRRFPHRAYGRVMATLTIPFYDGGAARAQVARARARREQAEQDLEIGRREIVNEARSALDDYRSAVADAAGLGEAVEADRDALKGVDIGRAIGDRSNLDLLNAAQELHEAEIARGRAERRAYANAFAVLTAMGRPIDEIVGGAERPAPRRPVAAAIPACAETIAPLPSRTAANGPAVKPLAFDLAGLEGSYRSGDAGVRKPAKVARTRPQRPIHYDLDFG